ncbi:hypothetical protein FE257_000078 [Aspergillus nanangensis]|uniref:Cytochrome P450 n=1 Tax=Aspergillus nanangensis TaxID=2582783 RepID=A0AAD4CZ63_ASPNN|nr:hypothetical protein FE257_000078 [Aspergillus nanangensis]
MTIVVVATAALLLLGIVAYRKVRFHRLQQFSAWPQPKPSLIYGHLKVFHTAVMEGNQKRHTDMVLLQMRKSLGNPPLFILDLRPVQPPLAVICRHEIAEQISKGSRDFPYSLPKSPTFSHLKPLLGRGSMITAYGEEWKRLRKRFSPGFAPLHLMGLLPCVLNKAWTFLQTLDRYAARVEHFPLEELCANLTMDIIGEVAMGEDLHAQLGNDKQTELAQLYRKLSSILSMSLEGIDHLSPRVMDETQDQLKTFLFDGYDTTSILLQWLFYEISRTPRVLAAIKRELDDIFGADSSPEAVRDMLLSGQGPELVRKMSYISAVIKETLRLHPPSGTARYTPRGSDFYVTLPDGSSLCLDEAVLYSCSTIIHRDPNVYNMSDEFQPERWLSNRDTSFLANTSTHRTPVSAWRAFERGPRDCLGQGLAMLEARVILACTVRRYKFEKVGLGELKRDSKDRLILNPKGQYEVESEIYNTMQVLATPVDGMQMKVQLVPGASPLSGTIHRER